MSNHKFLPEPTQCDSCKSKNIVFINNAEIYEEPRGDYPFIWFCYDCRANVACHEGTSNPMGFMATKNKRRLRHELHLVFDQLWQKGYMPRRDAYDWLSDELEIERDKCHVAMFSYRELKRSIYLVERKLKELKLALRKKAENEARIKRESERKLKQHYRHKEEYNRLIKKRRRKTNNSNDR